MKRPVSILKAVLCCALAAETCALAAAEAPAEFTARKYTNAAGESLPYRLMLPKDFDASKKYPLVIHFHGAGERGDNNVSQLMHMSNLFTNKQNREKYPCFVFVPQCPANQQWVDMPWGAESGTRPEKPSKAMSLALEALDSVLKEYSASIDTKRLYVTGISMGGYATWDCITRFPERFAAAAPICGGGDEKTVNASVAKLPVWAFHAANDGVVKVIRSRNMVKALKDAGGNPKYFEYPGGGHASWNAAYKEPEFFEWMFAQRLGEPDSYVLKTKEPPPASPAK